MKALLILGAAGAALLTSAQEPAPAADAQPGKITGKIVWEGERPDPKPALVIKEEESKGCKHGPEGMDTEDRSLLISEAGGVANVVVTLEAKGFEVQVPSDPIVLDQHGCRFEPHVLVVPVGATMRFGNSDDTNHNVHSFPKKNQPVNKNVAGGSEFDQLLDKAEVFEVKCDIHPWMKCYVYVADETHWAVSAEDGSFTLEGVPPGKYKLSWWHEELGKGKTEDVTVEAGKTATLEQKVGAKAESAGGRRRR